MTAFDDALRFEPLPDGRWRGHTHPAYANMVGPYGGITAAQALQAVRLQPACLGDPLALTVNYAAALNDGPYTVDARAVRTNRSTQHWTVELSQGGQVTTTATVVTALRREAFVDTEHAMPAVPPADHVPRVTPPGSVAWLDRYDMRPLDGALPDAWDGREHPDSLSRVWVRDDPPRPLDAPALAALCDVFYPRIWRRRAQWTPVGTVSMTVYFHADRAALQATGTGYLLGQARAQAFGGGFFDQTAQLWNEAGDLLATSHQVVYHK